MSAERGTGGPAGPAGPDGPAGEPSPEFPVHLTRSAENAAEIAALSERLGGAVGLAGVLDDLKFRARPALAPRLLGRAVSSGVRFDGYDQRDERWWPQGITTSADASDDDVVHGDRRVVVTTWYSKEVDGVGQGSRLTFLDLDSLRYRHVLLVEPRIDGTGRLDLVPVRIHAGGIVWYGPWLHIAATHQGFVSCRVDDVLAVPDDNRVPDRCGVLDDGTVASFGHHLVLPVRQRFRAAADDPRHRLRYSFLSLDRSQDPPQLLAGEYGRAGQPTRIARYALDPETRLPATDEHGRSTPAILHDGVRQMQGVAMVGGTYYASVSQGAWVSGTMYVGRPGRLQPYPFALPIGPEDISWWPSTDTFWSVSEHPGRRWVYTVPRGWFDTHRPGPRLPRRVPRLLRPVLRRLLAAPARRYAVMRSPVNR